MVFIEVISYLPAVWNVTLHNSLSIVQYHHSRHRIDGERHIKIQTIQTTRAIHTSITNSRGIVTIAKGRTKKTVNKLNTNLDSLTSLRTILIVVLELNQGSQIHFRLSQICFILIRVCFVFHYTYHSPQQLTALHSIHYETLNNTQDKNHILQKQLLILSVNILYNDYVLCSVVLIPYNPQMIHS